MMNDTYTQDPWHHAKQIADILIVDLSEALIENDDNIYTDTDNLIEEIESEGRDGFIPYTSGGREVVHSALLDRGIINERLPSALSHRIERDWRDKQEAWASQHPEHPPYAQACIDAWAEEYADDLEAFQEGWGAAESYVYFWVARIQFHGKDDFNGNGKTDMVYITVHLNIDLNYGRDYVSWLSHYKQTPSRIRHAYTREYDKETFENLSVDDIDELVATIKAHLEACWA